MAIEINDNQLTKAPKPAEAKYFFGTGQYYATKEEIPDSYKHPYMIVRDVDTGAQWMWLDEWILLGIEEFTYVESFVATSGQTTYTVSKNKIKDNGRWSVQVGAELWNSTTGVTAFTNGLLTINFATGEITFNVPLDAGTQVIIKYN